MGGGGVASTLNWGSRGWWQPEWEATSSGGVGEVEARPSLAAPPTAAGEGAVNTGMAAEHAAVAGEATCAWKVADHLGQGLAARALAWPSSPSEPGSDGGATETPISQTPG